MQHEFTVGTLDYCVDGGYWMLGIMVGDGTSPSDTLSDTFALRINYRFPKERKAEFDPSEFDKTVKKAIEGLDHTFSG
ncbi:hypothetical protein HYS31_04155 [Candidatus Woesearchaeota archaeon]|nr:hypothetical protein [Candidatus Woesearchaeota archaeon]